MSYNHIIKTENDRVLYFFIKEGLCVKDLLMPSDKYKIIYEEAVCDFYITDTGYGEVGIVCQDNKGSIIFLRESNNTFIKTTLLNNRSQLAYDKSFKLIKNNNWITLSYIINYQGNNILSFQIIDDEDEAPLVIDYVDNSCYFSFLSGNGDIFYFYNKENKFGYKIYKWAKKDFSDFESFGEGKIISAQADKNNKYYIIYENDTGYYLKIIDNKDFDFICEDYEIDFLKPNDKVNMLIEKKSLWIIVNRNGFTFGKRCDTNTYLFSGVYNFANEGNLIDYNISINEEDYILEKCFGYSVNMRPKLILYKDLLNTTKRIKSKEIITTEEEFNDFLNIEKEEETKEKIELTKFEIRIKEIEERIKKIEEFIQNQ